MQDKGPAPKDIGHNLAGGDSGLNIRRYANLLYNKYSHKKNRNSQEVASEGGTA